MPAMDSHRLRLAATLSPLVPGAFFAVLLFYFGGPSTPFGLVGLILIFAIPVSYTGLALFGLPLFLMLKKRDALTIVPFLIVGTSGGMVMFMVFSLLLSLLLGTSYKFGFDQIAWGAGMGFSVALTFCLLAGITSASSRRASLRSARG